MLTLACALPLACGAAHAADSDSPVAEPVAPPLWPVLAFGELRTGLNSVESTRVPAEQQPLRELGNRALLPPRASRDPWQSRLAATLEADDNLLLSPTNVRNGTALIVSPGLSWLNEGTRHRIEIDASMDLLQHVQGDYDGSRVDGSAVQGSAIGLPSQTTVVNYFGALLRSHDPAGSTPAGPVPGSTADQRFSTSYQRHELGFGWRTDPRTDLSARWIGTWADSHSPDYVRTQAQDFELGAHWQPTSMQRLGVLLRERRAEFQSQPNGRYTAVWVEGEQQWSPTLYGKAAIGAARGSDGRGLALWRAAVIQTYSRGQWDLAIERDVSAPAGLGRMYEMRSVRLGTSWRVGHRSRFDVSLSVAEFRPLDDPGAFSVRTLRPRLSYTLPFDRQTWLNLRYQGVDDRVLASDLRRQGDRLLVTILRTF
ncbi:MAG: hypothetical protein Q7T97_16115 [Burkholderiaceae bacterium]|nr:hypothetical protein [Burkholderiaceae bacterium]